MPGTVLDVKTPTKSLATLKNAYYKMQIYIYIYVYIYIHTHTQHTLEVQLEFLEMKLNHHWESMFKSFA